MGADLVVLRAEGASTLAPKRHPTNCLSKIYPQGKGLHAEHTGHMQAKYLCRGVCTCMRPCSPSSVIIFVQRRVCMHVSMLTQQSGQIRA